MPFGNRRDVNSKWTLDNKDTVRALAKQDKALGKVTKSTDTAEKSMGGLSKMSGAATVAIGNLVTQGFNKLVASMGDALQLARDYEDWIGKDTKAIEGMRKASAGLIDDLALMKARTRLLNGDFKLTEKQLEAVTKATIHYTRVNKTDFAESLKKVTDVITRGTSRGMKDLGINVDLLGKATVKTDKAIDLITKRFGGMDVQALNTNERIDQLKNTFMSLVGSIGSAILRSEWFTRSLQTMVTKARQLARGIVLDQGSTGKITDLGKRIAEEERRLKRLQSRAGRPAARALQSRSTFTPARNVNIAQDIATSKAQLASYKADLAKEQAAKAEKDAADEVRKWAAGDLANATKLLIAAYRKKAVARDGTGTARRPGIVQQVAGTGALPGFGDMFGSEYTGTPDFQAGGMGGAAAGIMQITAANKALRKSTEEAAASFSGSFMNNLNVIGTQALPQVTQGIAGLASGMWAAADAAIQGGDSFGMAMAKMLKATLLSVAAEATVQALMNLAAAAAQWFNPVAVANHLSAAAIYGSVAAIAGGGGLAMSAGIKSASGSTSSKKTSSSTPSYTGIGTTVKEDKRPLIINVDLQGWATNKAAARLASYQIEASATS